MERARIQQKKLASVKTTIVQPICAIVKYFCAILGSRKSHELKINNYGGFGYFKVLL